MLTLAGDEFLRLFSFAGVEQPQLSMALEQLATLLMMMMMMMMDDDMVARVVTIMKLSLPA